MPKITAFESLIYRMAEIKWERISAWPMVKTGQELPMDYTKS